MARGIAQAMLGSDVDVDCCGLETSTGLRANQKAVEVMDEIGIDISRHRTKDLSSEKIEDIDLLVAMTPEIALTLRRRGFARVEHLNVPDPWGEDIDTYREAREAIRAQLQEMREVLA
jgi:protein-tyrosine-phosphatase